MSSRKIAVLVVEDEALVRMSIVAELENNDMEVFEAADAHQAIKVLAGNPVVDVIFTDVDMPGDLDGIELARVVKERYPPIQVIVTSGHRNVRPTDLPQDGLFIAKPYMSDRVIETILAMASK